VSRSFLIDAQLPHIRAIRLRNLDFIALHISAVTTDNAPDDVIWAIAQRNGYVIVSKDKDFAEWVRASSSGPSVVWMRLGNQPNDPLWKALSSVWPDVCRALNAAERLVEVR
jgi:predicted nuclease of predicted toxin-antitoxin system